MSTRTRSPRRTPDDERLDAYGAAEDTADFSYESAYGLDEDITDEDIEDFLLDAEEEPTPGIFNLPTLAGLSTIAVGLAYLLERYGLLQSGFDFTSLLGPWLIGVVIILVGFGVLSWSPNRRRRRKRRVAAARRARQRRARRRRERKGAPRERRGRRREDRADRRRSRAARRRARAGRFRKSRTNRKVMGVCGGIGEYLGIDPTIVRIAFVIALFAGYGSPVLLYLLLSFVMGDPEVAPARPRKGDALDDERVIIIR